MGLMITLAPFQHVWDQWVKADKCTLDDAVRRLDLGSTAQTDIKESLWHGLWLLGLALGLSALCLKAAFFFPKTPSLSMSGWAFILASVLGVVLSFTPVKRLERYGASQVGYFCLYLLLAAIGARASFQAILHTPLLLLMAVILVAVHAACLIVYGRIRRVPMFFLVAASQANIGGTASAPIVAGLYQPPLASLGLLLAISANVIGTYVGLLIAQACHWVHP
jgi:uncharacterized membrane protein